MARKCFISLHPNRIRKFDSLKNHYFLTDGIVVSDVSSFLLAHTSGSHARANVANDLSYLMENHIVTEAPSFDYGDLESLANNKENFKVMLDGVNNVLIERERIYDLMIKGGQNHLADRYSKLNFELELV